MKYSLIYIILFALVVVCTGCGQPNSTEKNMSSKSNEELIRILEDQNGPEHLFSAVTKELAKRGPSASEAASALSLALTYPRRDSHLAGFALMAMGTEAKSAIPILFSELSHERSTVRRYAALVLGTIGEASQCAIPRLASHLWSPDSESRSAGAMSMDAITGIDLVDPENKLDPKTPGVLPLDEPEGAVQN